MNKEDDIESVYRKVFKEIEDAARNTIGKTTFKAHMKRKESEEIKTLKNQKKELKKEINAEKSEEKKKVLIKKHKILQEKTRGLSQRQDRRDKTEIRKNC